MGTTQRDHVGAHCVMVGHLAGQLAIAMELPDEVVDDVTIAGELHDIGKCAVPESLLAAPRDLTADEWRVMSTHAAIGALLCDYLGANAAISAAVRMHHDRFDAGATLMAGLLNLADALTTMLSNRAYRHAFSLSEALAELRHEAGGQFDPRIVDAAHQVAPRTFQRAA
jgi:putative nucleotidyltransferase with HDIG domain